MRRSRVLFLSLVVVTLSCSVVPYVRLYWERHNSLWDDAAYLVLLSLLVLPYSRDFKRFVRAKGNPLTGFAVAVGVLLIVDVVVNAPLNLYKTKVYVLLCAMYILCFLFTKLREHQKARLVGYLLMTWLAVSVVELYLRFNQPLLFNEFPWYGMTLQSALRPLVISGYLAPVASKVYGLGIGSQANVVALLGLLLFWPLSGASCMPKIIRIRIVQILVVCTAVAILPFALSLTSIIALMCAISVGILRRAARLTTSATFVLAAVVAGVLGFFAFRIGDLFGFSAATENREAYLYEFIYWPLAYLDDHLIRVLLGLHNDISAAPLENRYFNFLLTLGAPLSLAIAIALVRMLRTRVRRSSKERLGTLKLVLFVLFAVTYGHIGFTAHVPGLILLATVVVFVSERGSGVVSAQTTCLNPPNRPLARSPQRRPVVETVKMEDRSDDGNRALART